VLRRPQPCRGGRPTLGGATSWVREVLTIETRGAFTAFGLLRVGVVPSVVIDVIIDGVPRHRFGFFRFFAPGTYEICGTAAPDGRTTLCVQAVVGPEEQPRVVLEYC